MKQKQAILFDLDGTLIDSEYFYYRNWAPILAENFDLNIDFDDWIRWFAGHTLVRNVHFLKEKWDIQTSEEFMWKETREAYAETGMKTILLMPYAKEILSDLKNAGKRIGLVTSSYQTTVDTVLGHHGLLDYFEFFVTRERVTDPKPAPEPYLLALSQLQLPGEQVVAIEDTSTGLRAAQGAGLTCIAVSKQAVERSRLTAAAYLVDDLKEARDILL